MKTKIKQAIINLSAFNENLSSINENQSNIKTEEEERVHRKIILNKLLNGSIVIPKTSSKSPTDKRRPSTSSHDS
jgi:hypothetical protein